MKIYSSLGNSEPSILFDGLQKAIEGKEILPQNISMSEIFSSWSDQKGYPVITVTRKENGEIDLTQVLYFNYFFIKYYPILHFINFLNFKQRYHNNITETTSEKYWVPINWATSNNITFKDTSAQVWFDPELDILKLPLILNENEWFIINKQQTGIWSIRKLYNERYIQSIHVIRVLSLIVRYTNMEFNK